MIYHTTKQNEISAMPPITIREAREKGASVGVYYSGEKLYFCFIFRSGSAMQAAVMPFADNPNDTDRICKAINRRTKKDYTESLIGKTIQFLKRSQLDGFSEIVREGRISNRDFEPMDAMILFNDMFSGRHITKYQLSISKQYRTSSTEFTRHVLNMMIRLSTKMLRSGSRDTRLLHLMDSLSKALDFGYTEEFNNDESINYRMFAAIVGAAKEAIDTDPEKWYRVFSQVAPPYIPKRQKKNEFA